MPKPQQRRAAERAVTNQKNAQFSTGPKTPEGKAAASRNSFKHGLYSNEVVTPTSEDGIALDTLKADLRAQHSPVNDTEEILVNEMAEQFWRIRRARRYEALLLEIQGALNQLTAIQRMMSAAERGFHKSLTLLRQLQKDRGFVPQNACVHPETLPQETAPSEETSPGQTSEHTAAASSTTSAGFVPQTLPPPHSALRPTHPKPPPQTHSALIP